MILLKISNASEVVASKLGKFIESLTPDGIDHSTVEDFVVKEMIQNLSSEGLKGEVAVINGMDIDGENLLLKEGLKIRKNQEF